jgi:S1-C subfamily serine protease
LEEKLIFTEAGPKESNQTRRSFNVTFGLIPSYGSDAVGLEIDGAKKDGPAGIAGLKKGDIITSIGGKDIKNIYDYMYRLAELKPGETVEVKVMRGDDELTLKVIL